MNTKVFLILLSIILFGCQSGNRKPVQTGELTVIDISKNYPKKEILLQDIADIEYVPLETTDDVLLGQMSFLSYISDKYIVVFDFSGDIFVFNRNGKIISHFNRTGQGGEEYTRIGGGIVILDEKNEEIFVGTNTTNRILVYSINGTYKRTLKFSDDLMIWEAYNFDDETLLVYDMYASYRGAKNMEKPYMLMSKKDGSIVHTFDINLPVRYSNRVAINLGNNMFTSASISTPNNRYFGHQDFVIADISSDTIYRLTNNRDLTRWLVRKPSVHSSELKTVWSVPLTTDKFIILHTTELDYIAAEKGSYIPSKTLMYEFATGEINEVSIVFDDFAKRQWPLINLVPDIPKNMSAYMFPPHLIIAAYEAKKLKGDLEKLAPTLDAEDNPVLVIVKFK